MSDFEEWANRLLPVPMPGLVKSIGQRHTVVGIIFELVRRWEREQGVARKVDSCFYCPFRGESQSEPVCNLAADDDEDGYYLADFRGADGPVPTTCPLLTAPVLVELEDAT